MGIALNLWTRKTKALFPGLSRIPLKTVKLLRALKRTIEALPGGLDSSKGGEL